MKQEQEAKLGKAMVAYERVMYAQKKRGPLPCDRSALPRKEAVENYIRRIGVVRSCDVAHHFNCSVNYASKVISRCKGLVITPVPGSSTGAVYYSFEEGDLT